MENGHIFFVIVIAIVFGRKSIPLGFFLGIALTVILYFVFHDFELKKFGFSLLAGSFVSLLSSGMANLLLPGIKGGNENHSPTFLGMNNGSTSGGGIIYTDEDEKNARLNKRDIR